MKFAFLSLLFKRYPLEYSFQTAKKYCFDGIEIWGGRPHAYPWDLEQVVPKIKEWKEKYQVQVPMYTPELLAYPYNLSSWDESERRDTIAYLKQAVDLCADIGCPEMLVSSDHPGYGISDEAAWEHLVEGLQEICLWAGEKNVLLRMEPLGPNTSPIVTRTSDLARLIRDVGSPHLKAMMDMVIPPLCAEPYSNYFDRLRDDFSYIHLCGCDGLYETHTQLIPGQEAVSFEDFFQILQSHNYDAWCSVELLDPYYRDPELYLAGAIRAIRTLVPKA